MSHQHNGDLDRLQPIEPEEKSPRSVSVAVGDRTTLRGYVLNIDRTRSLAGTPEMRIEIADKGNRYEPFQVRGKLAKSPLERGDIVEVEILRVNEGFFVHRIEKSPFVWQDAEDVFPLETSRPPKYGLETTLIGDLYLATGSISTVCRIVYGSERFYGSHKQRYKNWIREALAKELRNHVSELQTFPESPSTDAEQVQILEAEDEIWVPELGERIPSKKEEKALRLGAITVADPSDGNLQILAKCIANETFSPWVRDGLRQDMSKALWRLLDEMHCDLDQLDEDWSEDDDILSAYRTVVKIIAEVTDECMDRIDLYAQCLSQDDRESLRLRWCEVMEFWLDEWSKNAQTATGFEKPDPQEILGTSLVAMSFWHKLPEKKADGERAGAAMRCLSQAACALSEMDCHQAAALCLYAAACIPSVADRAQQKKIREEGVRQYKRLKLWARAKDLILKDRSLSPQERYKWESKWRDRIDNDTHRRREDRFDKKVRQQHKKTGFRHLLGQWDSDDKTRDNAQ